MRQLWLWNPQSKPTKKAGAHIVQRMMKEMNFHFDTFKKSLQTNWKCSKIRGCVGRVFHAPNISGGNLNSVYLLESLHEVVVWGAQSHAWAKVNQHPTSAPSIWCPWWLNFGWTSTELISDFTFVTHFVRSRSYV